MLFIIFIFSFEGTKFLETSPSLIGMRGGLWTWNPVLLLHFFGLLPSVKAWTLLFPSYQYLWCSSAKSVLTLNNHENWYTIKQCNQI